MIYNRELFERCFGIKENGDALNLNSSERSVAELFYNLACEKIEEVADDELDDEPGDNDPGDNGDDESLESFDQKIETAMENFERAVELFKLSNKARKAFLERFGDWSILRENNIKRLKEIAKGIQSDKFNSDIAKVVGGVVGVVGGIVAGLSLLTPLAAVTLPLTIGGGITSAIGGGVVVGTTGTEILLLKNMLEETKTVILKDKESFKPMEEWFTHTIELKEALNSLISFDLLDEMSKDLKAFQTKVNDNSDSFKSLFGDVMNVCVGKMCKRSKIIELFGNFAPIVMTFVFVVCLWRDYNRMILDCIFQLDRVVLGLLSGIDIGVQAGRLGFGLATKGAVSAGRAVSTVVATSVFLAAGIAMDIVNIVLSSIDINNCPEVEQAKNIKDAAEKLKEEHSFVESVYEELQKWQCMEWSDVAEWKTFIVKHVPDAASQIDLKMSTKPHLSEEAWGCMRLQRFNSENCWLLRVPASHSQILLRQSHLNVNGKSCQINPLNRWKTFIIHHIPDDAVQEDIKMAVRSHLPEEAWNSAKLQRLSTAGNNWLLKIPSIYSQSLVQQSHIVIKQEHCSVTQ